MRNRKNWGEIVADSVGIILASYDAISASLTFATYALAANPEVQERLANEIYEHFENNPVSNMYIDNNTICCSLLHGMSVYDCYIHVRSHELQYGS